MGKRSSISSVPLLVVVAAALVGVGLLLASPARAQKICGADILTLVTKCEKFVKVGGPKEDPSEDCCTEVRKLDVPCLCDNLPAGIEKTISLEKAVYVARKCGKTVKGGTKCGNFTVPPRPLS